MKTGHMIFKWKKKCRVGGDGFVGFGQETGY